MKRVGMPDLRRAFWFGLAAALVLLVVRPASAQMQEGTLSGTFAAFGTVKATAAGKERLVLAIDENGLSVTNGVLNHVTWHCSGLADYTNGLGQSQGFCVGNDPSGDQVVFNWESEKHAPEQKVVRGTFSWTGGTGKTPGSAVPERMWIIRENSSHQLKERSSAISLSRATTELPRPPVAETPTSDPEQK
jgi:hypothetical protein